MALVYPLWVFLAVLNGLSLVTLAGGSTLRDRFTEELFVNPLDTGHVYLHFKFAIATPLKQRYSHVELFPKSVSDILRAHSVDELHVHLTQGVFRHQRWGYPLLSAPSGGEVWAWFKEDVSVSDKWRGLTNSLAGLLCATFNDISSANSMSPKWSFRPEGLVNGTAAVNTSRMRYSMLPRENLCTENLTPWKKLLPCYDRAGLAKLLNAIKLLSAHYFSIGFDATTVCGDAACAERFLHLQVSATAVVESGSIQDTGKFDWSLRNLLESDLDIGCPVSDSSLIYVRQSMKGKMVFWPAPSYSIASDAGEIAVYDLRDGKTWPKTRELGGKSPNKLEYDVELKPVITAQRYVSGVGQQNGGIRCSIENNSPDTPVTVSYLEMIPWFLRLYFHTIRLTSNGKDVTVKNRNFVPGRDRTVPHQIELIFTVEPSSSVEFAVDFDYTLLKWLEYPPDANHGFEVPAAVINARLHSCSDFQFPKNFTYFRSDGDHCFLRLYTEPLLVNLPTPDFSMPYNVICMTCTVLALAFGPIHAITTKHFTLLDPTTNPALVGKMKIRAKDLLQKLRNRLKKEKAKTE